MIFHDILYLCLEGNWEHWAWLAKRKNSTTKIRHCFYFARCFPHIVKIVLVPWKKLKLGQMLAIKKIILKLWPLTRKRSLRFAVLKRCETVNTVSFHFQECYNHGVTVNVHEKFSAITVSLDKLIR